MTERLICLFCWSLCVGCLGYALGFIAAVNGGYSPW